MFHAHFTMHTVQYYFVLMCDFGALYIFKMYPSYQT